MIEWSGRILLLLALLGLVWRELLVWRQAIAVNDARIVSAPIPLSVTCVPPFAIVLFLVNENVHWRVFPTKIDWPRQ
jgi:hypothetical protein